MALALLAAPAAAQSGPAAPTPPTVAAAHAGPGEPDAIVVTGHPPIDFALLAGTATIEGDALIGASRGQIGETLASLPGVSATGFAPGASRPVLRGMDGDRIRVLVDGIGSIDASSVSADHAVTLDALTTDHIDVIHGPAVLMFGGQAIGGAVNALDRRIPRSVPDRPEGMVVTGYGTAANERSVGAILQVPLAGRLAASFDASWRKSGNLRAGGLVNAPWLRTELLAEADELRANGESSEADEFAELAGQSGKVPNSDARTLTLGAGLAFIDAGGNLGLSVQRYDTRYGVPLRPGAGHGHHEDGENPADEDHGEAPVSIDLVQTRVDFRGALNLSGPFDSLQLRGAWGEYRHIEFEGAEEGTRFAAAGLEFRADLVQADRNGWRGRSGIQYQARRMTVLGAEAFVPGNDTTRLGVFTLQSVKIGAFEVEAAGRFERASVKTVTGGFSRNFDLWSAAAGLSWRFAQGFRAGVNYVRGSRAPAPEELLSDGLHVATQAYEIGSPGFRKETSDGFEAWLRYEGPRARIGLTAYRTDFADFIAALPDGEAIEGFPVFRYAQHSARFKGVEFSADWDAIAWQDGGIALDASVDYTRAALAGSGPVPRVPPLRVRGGIETRLSALRLRGEVEWNHRQSRIASFEQPVRGFTLVNLSADWHPLGEDGPLTLIASASNLFDAVGRRAASFTRDFVPVSGRDVRVTAKLSF